MRRKSATPLGRASDEARRQSAADELLLMTDTGIDSAFERVTHLVATQLHVPISAFSIVDRERQYFRWAQGLDIEEAPRKGSFCGYTILQDDLFIVSDARRHQAFKDNPLVTEARRGSVPRPRRPPAWPSARAFKSRSGVS